MLRARGARPGPFGPAEAEGDRVGPARETRPQHEARHSHKDWRACARCIYYKLSPKWIKSYGSLGHQVGRNRHRSQWLCEKPARKGGLWGIGCALCADLLYRVGATPAGRTLLRGRRLATKWARFEVRSRNAMGAEHVHQHSLTSCHRLAVGAFLRPDCPLTVMCQEGPVDDDLLRGAVPQPPDWLRVWRSMKTPTSFHSAASNSQTEHFIRSMRARPVPRKAFAQMAAVLAEALRCTKRKWLSQASSICLSMDDKADYRIVRFKCNCDVPPPAGEGPRVGWHALPPKGARRGILAVVRNGGLCRRQIEDFDEDRSLETAESIVRAIKVFCTPLGEECDQELYTHILSNTRIFTADGGPKEQKAARILRERYCQNIVLIIRDPAHAVRIACRDPLHMEARFQEQHDRLFGRHGLIPDVKNSFQWRLKLQAAQQRVIDTDGSQGGGLTRIMRHFSYAEQRFDSFASPMRKYVCMVNAVALLLAAVATDGRLDRPTRLRATQSLEAMTEESLMSAGVTADYAEECTDFIRKFDVTDHDPAITARQRRSFLQRMRVLFLQGHIVTPAPTGMTLTAIVLDQCREARAIPYGDGRLKMLWTPASPQKLEAVMQSIHVVVETMMERV